MKKYTVNIEFTITVSDEDVAQLFGAPEADGTAKPCEPATPVDLEVQHTRFHFSGFDGSCICTRSCCNDEAGNCTCRECTSSEHSHAPR